MKTDKKKRQCQKKKWACALLKVCFSTIALTAAIAEIHVSRESVEINYYEQTAHANSLPTHEQHSISQSEYCFQNCCISVIA